MLLFLQQTQLLTLFDYLWDQSPTILDSFSRLAAKGYTPQKKLSKTDPPEEQKKKRIAFLQRA